VKPYAALFRASLSSVLRYRMTFAVGMVGMLFQLVALLAVWHALLADRALGGFGWPQMRAYLLVGFTCGLLVSTFTDITMAYRIIDGQVALDLVKPVDYQWARFAETLGGLGGELVTAVAAWAVVIAISGGMLVPGPGQGVLFVLSMLLVVVLKFLIVYLTGLVCFWTQHYNGVIWTRVAIVSLFSGALVPLSFLPGWLSTVAGWLPFAGMASTPGLLFIGQLHGTQAVRLVTLQAGWVVVLWLGARWAFGRAVRQLTVHGG
jgi:ABC-2 type transport system permease protein